MCLVKVEVECGTVLTYRSTDEFGSCLPVLSIRFDELVHSHVRLERGHYTIEVIHLDTAKFFHGYIDLVVSLVQRLHRWFQSISIASSMQGQTPEETEVISVPLVMNGFRFQTDDGFVLIGVDWKRGHAYTTYGIIDDAVDEEGDFGHEFAHPPESGL